MADRHHFIIADDHPLFRDALRQTVEQAFANVQITEAGNLQEVADAIEAADEPDIVLFDLKMPGVRGFSGLTFLRAQYPAAPICVVSASDDASTVRNALQLGASGFVSKSAPPNEIRSAIQVILDGGRWIPAGLTEADGGDGVAGRLKSLTPQQVRVLMMLSEGLLNKQIAYELGVSEATVKAHVSAILQKLKVQNRTKAVLVAAQIETGDWRELQSPD